MRVAIWLGAMFVMFIISETYADMYVWVDENGVKHYTDRAPSADEVSPEQVTQAETATYEFGHPLYNKTGDREYCGSFELLRIKRNDAEQYLLDVKHAQRCARENRKRLATELASQSCEKCRDSYRKYIYEYECVSEWADSTIKKLKRAKP